MASAENPEAAKRLDTSTTFASDGGLLGDKELSPVGSPSSGGEGSSRHSGSGDHARASADHDHDKNHHHHNHHHAAAAAPAHGRRSKDDKSATPDSVQDVELTDSNRAREQWPRFGADALIGESRHHGDGSTGVFYRVYKRRWFGLIQLTLLNIIVSWDVSVIDPPRLCMCVWSKRDETGSDGATPAPGPRHWHFGSGSDA
jgi:hypothetical protein